MADYSLSVADEREQLVRRGEVSRIDYLAAKRDVIQQVAEVKTRGLEIERLAAQATVDERENRVRLAELKSSAAELEAAIAAKRADLDALQRDLEDRQIRAPLDGVLGEVATLRPGQVVQAGTRLATIVPQGDLIAVAEFAPAIAAGRIAPGQLASMALSGFSWQEYGTLPAKVMRVGSEVRNDLVRVELALLPDQRTRLRLQHGLPGEVQIAVGDVPPWQIVLGTVRGREDGPPKGPGP
jgi:membrane fusion protein (multidrug efflux system)